MRSHPSRAGGDAYQRGPRWDEGHEAGNSPDRGDAAKPFSVQSCRSEADADSKNRGAHASPWETANLL